MVTSRAILAPILFAAIGCAPLSNRVIRLASPDPAFAKLPFSEAVRVGSTLYLSGQIGTRPGTLELVSGGIGPETEQTLKNIERVLTRHDSSLDKVVKCTVFLADIGEWTDMNTVYVRFFGGGPPARSALGANGLALGARVEIECMAVTN